MNLAACLAALLGAWNAAAGQGSPAPPKLPAAAPADAGMNAGRLNEIDRVVAEGIEAGKMPGCVVAVGRRGRLVHLKAYGHRQLEPERVAMTTDTVFDMASLTKPIATATSIMLLVERGEVRLDEPVATYIPEFARNGKQAITVLHLLTHQGGLIPDNPLADYDGGIDESMRRIYELAPRAEPGTRFIYTDVGFIVLAEIVRRVAGRRIDEFARGEIFSRLGMNETGYLPAEALRRRAAVTEQREGRWMQGEVHDPRAYRLDGVAGHAGLFSTAQDLAVYAQMMLGQGGYQGVRILDSATVDLMTRRYEIQSDVRGLGWDKQSRYSSNRGERLDASAFGHGGFTGTAMWMDPHHELFVIFLSNRVHPHGKGLVNPLAGQIATIAAGAIDEPPPGGAPSGRQKDGVAPESPRSRHAAIQPVLTGIDVLQRERFQRLAGRRVGLITNHTGVSRSGTSTIRLLNDAPGVELRALFSPEHGLEGKLDIPKVADSRDANTGLKVYSLYGESRQPAPEQLAELDALVFDIQDIGARFYTYVSTMGLAMRAAAAAEIRFIVLDRPNPVGGLVVEGPVLDEGRESFVGFHRIAVRHGMTAGELARMFNEEMNIGAELEVVPVENWSREAYYDATGLLWINPSPNMRSLAQAVLYPGIGLLETTNVSVGRGTDTPFEVVGAPWIDGRRLAQRLNDAGLAGVRFVPIEFAPSASKHAGEVCQGINVIVTHRDAFRSVPVGIEIARQLRSLYPDAWDMAAFPRLLSSQKTFDGVRDLRTLGEIIDGHQPELGEFLERRRKYLIY